MDVISYVRQLSPGVSSLVLPWLKDMPTKTLERCTLAKLGRGKTLVQMLDRCERVYLLCKGTIRTTSGSVDGGSHVIDDFCAPAIFGEMEVIGDSPFYHGTLTATSDCELICMARSDYLQWLLSDAHVALGRSRQVVSSLARQSSQERSLLSWDGTQRLMYALCQRCAQLPADKKVVITDTRQTLAERTGVSAKTVCRALKELEHRGMLHLEGRRITIGTQERNALYAAQRRELAVDLHDGTDSKKETL